MSAVVIDTASAPGAWRGALARRAAVAGEAPGGSGERLSCAACGQAVCEHPDAVWQGVLPAADGAPA